MHTQTRSTSRQLLQSVIAALMTLAAPLAWSADAAAGEKLLKDNKCTKCHTVERGKDGPALRDVAAKFKGTPDAHNKLIHHFTAGEMVTFPDGHKEKHKAIKDAPQAELKNLADWILSLEGGKKY